MLAGGACAGSGTKPNPTPTAGGKPLVATAPADQLAKAGSLTICADTTNPPQASLDPDTLEPIGSDVELAAEIAARMGLSFEVKPVDVDAAIPALNEGDCDIVVSAQTITPVRQEQADMIPYFQAGQAFVVKALNPLNIRAVLDLCGRSVAVRRGSIEADHLNPTGLGAYAATEGLTARCKAQGKPAIASVVAETDEDALAALQSGAAEAHFVAEAVAGHEVLTSNGAVEMVTTMTLDRATQGIAVAKTHSKLRDAVKACLESMLVDGTYDQILARWGLTSDKISAPLE
jgi:polar amino acid transport system substrate-binding protein